MNFNADNPFKDLTIMEAENKEFDVREIVGWSGWDIEHFYRQAVDHFDNCVFVEVGAFFGRSVIYLAQEIKRRKKNIKVFAVDTFCGHDQDPCNHLYKSVLDLHGGDIYEEFKENVKAAGVDDVIIPMRGVSWEVAGQIANDSLAMVFLDASHYYVGCKKDIDAYWPKLMLDGWIAGDDYNHSFPGVIEAVDHLHRECWWWGEDCVPELVIRNRVWKMDKKKRVREKVGIDDPPSPTAIDDEIVD